MKLSLYKKFAVISSILALLASGPIRGQIINPAGVQSIPIAHTDSIGPNHRDWTVTDSKGGGTPRHLLELATGMNFWNPVTRSWHPSGPFFLHPPTDRYLSPIRSGTKSCY
jgi:hypothetical protein